MNIKDDFQKEWPKIQKQLMQFSKDAVELAKKGEKQVVKLSKQGKLHLDATTIGLKKERLYYQIGKEYVKTQCPGTHSAQLQKHIDELQKLERDESVLKRKLRLKKKTAA